MSSPGCRRLRGKGPRPSPKLTREVRGAGFKEKPWSVCEAAGPSARVRDPGPRPGSPLRNEAYALAKGCSAADAALSENAQRTGRTGEVRLSAGRRAGPGRPSVRRRFRSRLDTQRGGARGSLCAPNSSTPGYVSTTQSVILKIRNVDPGTDRGQVGRRWHPPRSQSALREAQRFGAVTIPKGLRPLRSPQSWTLPREPHPPSAAQTHRTDTAHGTAHRTS